MGKPFHLVVKLYVDATMQTLKARLLVHGGHDEKCWTDETEPDKVFTIEPIAFFNVFEYMGENPIGDALRAYRVARRLLDLPVQPVGLLRTLLSPTTDTSKDPQLGISALVDNDKGQYAPPLTWAIDELSPTRVLLTVTCDFDRYHMLAYLAQVLEPLLDDYPDARVDYVANFLLSELPDDLREYYLEVMGVLGGKQKRDVSVWGYGGRLDKPGDDDAIEGWFTFVPKTPGASLPEMTPEEMLEIGEDFIATAKARMKATDAPTEREIAKAKARKYGANLTLSYDDVRQILYRCRSFQAKGSSVPHYYRTLKMSETDENYFALETLRKWLQDPRFL